MPDLSDVILYPWKWRSAEKKGYAFRNERDKVDALLLRHYPRDAFLTSTGYDFWGNPRIIIWLHRKYSVAFCDAILRKVYDDRLVTTYYLSQFNDDV